MADKPLEAIELLRPLVIAGQERAVGDVVAVALIGEMTAQQLIDAKRAKPAVKKAEG